MANTVLVGAQWGDEGKGKVVDLVLFITLFTSGGRVRGAMCTFQEMGQFETSAQKLESYQRLNRELETLERELRLI